MEAGISQLLTYLIGAAVVGLVTTVTRLWREHNDLKLKLSEYYLKKDELNEIKDEVREIRDVVFRIALKMDVPVFSEKYK